MRRGLDITECEVGTKIRAKYLRAMEEEHYDLLPSPAYVRGFLRTYAEYLGLDGQLVTDEYESRFGIPGQSDEHRLIRPRGGSGGSRTAPARGAATGRGRGRGTGRAARGSRSSRRHTETQLLWLAIGGVMTVALLVWMGVGQPSSDTPALQGTGPVPQVVPDAPNLQTPEAPEPLRITLTGLGGFGSYIIVNARNASGRQVFAGTLGDGQSKTFAVQRSLFVRTYNAEGLRVTVGGRATPLTGGTGDFLISRTGVQRLSAQGADTNTTE